MQHVEGMYRTVHAQAFGRKTKYTATRDGGGGGGGGNNNGDTGMYGILAEDRKEAERKDEDARQVAWEQSAGADTRKLVEQVQYSEHGVALRDE